MRLKALSILLAALACSASAKATTIVSYLVGDYASTTNMADPVTVDSSISASILTHTIPTVSSQTPGFSSGTDTFFANAATLPAALDTGKYVTFTLTIASGYTMDLSSLSLNLGATNTINPSATYNVSAALRTSLDTATNAGSTVTSSIGTTGSTSSTFSLLPQSIDLSGVSSLQGISGTVVFYLYFWDDTSSQSASMRMNNLVLSGTVIAIPEPSSFGILAGLATLAVVGVGRRRRV